MAEIILVSIFFCLLSTTKALSTLHINLAVYLRGFAGEYCYFYFFQIMVLYGFSTLHLFIVLKTTCFTELHVHTIHLRLIIFNPCSLVGVSRLSI